MTMTCGASSRPSSASSRADSGYAAPQRLCPHYDYPAAFPSDGQYAIPSHYHSRPSKLRIACAGVGASGLCLAYKVQRLLEPGSFELTMYEKNRKIGGTWVENHYPGVACDVPSHIYTFSFAPNPDWSSFYVSGEEIQAYFEKFAVDNGCHRFVQLESKVVEAKWNGTECIWMLTIEDRNTKARRYDWAHCFVNATGILSDWSWPDIPGLEKFQGPKMHSADWDHTVPLEDKRIGLIGTGSTGVQLLPQLQLKAKHLNVYMRSPMWISPPYGRSALEELQAGGSEPKSSSERQHRFSEEERRTFREHPEKLLAFRRRMEAEMNADFAMFKRGSESSKQRRKDIMKEMEHRLENASDELKAFIVPTFSPGCRRLTPGDGFLESLTASNVTPVMKAIKTLTETGIVTDDGLEEQLDVLICATGFNPSFTPAFRLVNGSGKTIQEDWEHGPNMYCGITTPRFPNYFTICGPGATWSNGSILPAIEGIVEYSVKCMRKMQKEQVKSMEINQESVDELYAHFDEFHKDTVWQEPCRSWYKNNQISNRIYLWSGSTIHFLKTIQEPRWEDYKFQYRHKNRYAYLGNGDVKATVTRDVEGLSTYIRQDDREYEIA